MILSEPAGHTEAYARRADTCNLKNTTLEPTNQTTLSNGTLSYFYKKTNVRIDLLRKVRYNINNLV